MQNMAIHKCAGRSVSEAEIAHSVCFSSFSCLFHFYSFDVFRAGKSATNCKKFSSLPLNTL